MVYSDITIIIIKNVTYYWNIILLKVLQTILVVC